MSFDRSSSTSLNMKSTVSSSTFHSYSRGHLAFPLLVILLYCCGSNWVLSLFASCVTVSSNKLTSTRLLNRHVPPSTSLHRHPSCVEPTVAPVSPVDSPHRDVVAASTGERYRCLRRGLAPGSWPAAFLSVKAPSSCSHSHRARQQFTFTRLSNRVSPTGGATAFQLLAPRPGSRDRLLLWAADQEAVHSSSEEAALSGQTSDTGGDVAKDEATVEQGGANVKSDGEGTSEGHTRDDELLEGFNRNMGKEFLSGLEMVERFAEMGLRKGANARPEGKTASCSTDDNSGLSSGDTGSRGGAALGVTPSGAKATSEAKTAQEGAGARPASGAVGGLRRKVARLDGALRSLQDFVASWGSSSPTYEDDVLQDAGELRRGRRAGLAHRGRMAALGSSDDAETTTSDSDGYASRVRYTRPRGMADYSDDSSESSDYDKRISGSSRPRSAEFKNAPSERRMRKLRRMYWRVQEMAERDGLLRALAKQHRRSSRLGNATDLASSTDEDESSALEYDDIGVERRRGGRRVARNRMRRILAAAEEAAYPDLMERESGGGREQGVTRRARGWIRPDDVRLNAWTGDRSEDSDVSGESDSRTGDDNEEPTEGEGDFLSGGGSGAATGLKNYQHDVPVDKGLLERQLHIIKDIMGLQRTNVGIELVDDNRIRELNFQFLGKNKSTDILSFPYTDNPDVLRAFPLLRSLRTSSAQRDIALGYIFVSPAFVQRRCDDDRASMEESILLNVPRRSKERGIAGIMRDQFTVQERLPLLLIHGLLHLLRYDNTDSADKEQLIAKEESIASEFLVRSREYRPSAAGHYVVGMGTDLCYIPRIKESIEKHETRFLEHVCSPRERHQYKLMKARYMDDVAGNKMKRQSWHDVASAYLAKRFATKEAVAKALGTGLRHVTDAGVRLQDIEVWSMPSGQPTVQLLGRARDIGQRLGIVDVMVAQTDERDYAVSLATACGSTGDIVPPFYNNPLKQ
eukprot:GHVS01059896.1.p1 GENE.GHVS01059896.1~~GHVS01059896.1.p1  ORF type:complete len:973 (-),score=125.89 GHVS01059896.1:138-3056(-)